MYLQGIIQFLITTQIVEKIICEYLEAELNYQKPKRERNNIVNKAVWRRNNLDAEKIDSHYSRFYHENSLDNMDGQIQNLESFPPLDHPVFSPEFSQLSRRKRSSNSFLYDKPRSDWPSKPFIEQKNTDSMNSKLINNLASITDKLYEVARYVNNNTTYLIQNNSRYVTNNSLTPYNPNPADINKDTDVNNNINNTINNGTTLKRSMQYDFETEVIKHFEFSEELNKTEENRDSVNYNKENRNVFDKSNSEWQQNAPVPDVNVYRVVPKEPIQKSKPVTERGLIKVISMLTRSFRKIMKQHAEITAIHSKITDINDDFIKTTGAINAKFKDFDLKYLYLVKLQEKLKEYNTKIEVKEEYFKNKEKEMSRNFVEFENQQKKFLQQQKQFYSMQKLMLAQNEKINMKQSLIAKTQSEISHRQNNFARMLKKAKQLYADRRISLAHATKEPPIPKTVSTLVPNVTLADSTTEPIKINLFSVPSSYRIPQDPDELILREKDQQPIDDLVYKYYFNNTFIDSVMQKHILNSFMGNSRNTGNQNVKIKRQDSESTTAPPISDYLYDAEDFDTGNRVKRWINHHSKHNKRKNRGKESLSETANYTDGKQSMTNQGPSEYQDSRLKPVRNIVNIDKKQDPFLSMAMKFCNEIGHNGTRQSLGWCIEKTLRRLQFLEPKKGTSPLPKMLASLMKTHRKPPASLRWKQANNLGSPKIEPTNKPKKFVSITTEAAPRKLISPSLKTTKSAYTHSTTKSSHKVYRFPDNNLLEFNLKKFLSEPALDDFEGNVYFEGSARESDLREQGV